MASDCVCSRPESANRLFFMQLAVPWNPQINNSFFFIIVSSQHPGYFSCSQQLLGTHTGFQEIQLYSIHTVSTQKHLLQKKQFRHLYINMIFIADRRRSSSSSRRQEPEPRAKLFAYHILMWPSFQFRKDRRFDYVKVWCTFKSIDLHHRINMHGWMVNVTYKFCFKSLSLMCTAGGSKCPTYGTCFW